MNLGAGAMSFVILLSHFSMLECFIIFKVWNKDITDILSVMMTNRN